MDSSIQLTSKYAYSTRVTVSADPHKEEHDDFRALCTLVVQSGACYLQTYLSSSECRRLANLLLDAAGEIEQHGSPVVAGE